MSTITQHRQQSQALVSGGEFRYACEVLSSEMKSQKNIEMFPFTVLPMQGSPHCSATSYRDRASEAFGALMERSGFRSHSEGLATLSDHKRHMTLEDIHRCETYTLWITRQLCVLIIINLSPRAMCLHTVHALHMWGAAGPWHLH